MNDPQNKPAEKLGEQKQKDVTQTEHAAPKPVIGIPLPGNVVQPPPVTTPKQ